MFLLTCLAIGIGKMTRLLWRRKSWAWGFGVLVIACLAIGYYIWLSVNAVQFYREGRGAQLIELKIAKQIILALSLSSFVWIIIDRVRKRKTEGP